MLRIVVCDWYLHTKKNAKLVGKRHQQQVNFEQSLFHTALAVLEAILTLIFYRGKAHMIELKQCILLALVLMKGHQKALHSIPIFKLLFDHLFDRWLVCEMESNLVHLLGCPSMHQIELNDSAERDSRMHLPNLLKERLPIAPRTLKKLASQFNPLLFNCCSIKYFKTVSVQIACVT